MSVSATQYATFIVCAPGLETLLSQELTDLMGSVKCRQLRGGVQTRLSPQELWRVVHGCRLAESVRVRLGSFKARRWDQLEQGFKRLASHAYIPKNAPVDVRVTCHKSRLNHTGAIAERVQKLLSKVASDKRDAAPFTLWIRIARDNVTVSADAGGEDLWRRGYRTHVGKAPLRETIAAALVQAARQTQPALPTAVWDPFCGSATIVAETALDYAGQWVRSRERVPACVRWPAHHAAAYEAWWDDIENQAPFQARTIPTLVASDADKRELDAARNNLRQTGLRDGQYGLFHGDFEAIERAGHVPDSAAVLSNLPYGLRVKTDLSGTFRRFGALLSRRTDLDPVIVLNGYEGFQEATGHPWELLTTLSNRGLRVQLLRLNRSRVAE